jgi:ubiquinone/menaquinone biosynthesis C-methylase UbiE
MARNALAVMAGGTGDALALGLGAAAGAQIGLRAGIAAQPRPMPHQMAGWLDHAWRLAYRSPERLLAHLGLFAGMTAADLGCGAGLFTAAMARSVGETGAVHAVDIQAPLLARTGKRLAAAGLAGRVWLHHAGLHSLPLPDGCVDAAVLVAVLGEVPARELALGEVQRVLKSGGRLLISEELPDPAYVPAPLVRDWAEAAGLRFGAQIGSPFCYTQLYYRD